MAKFDPLVQALVKEYVACLQAKSVADEQLKAAKQKLLDYSLETKKKVLLTPTGKVTVSVNNRTVFPKSDQPGRRELEAAVKAAGYWDQAQSFDVIKLAEAYDNNQLPEELKSRLAPLAKSDRQVRIFVNEPAFQTSR